jgi:hypothetical protein
MIQEDSSKEIRELSHNKFSTSKGSPSASIKI